MGLCFFIAFIDDLEPLEGEVAIIDVDERGMAVDDLSQAAGRNDLDVIPSQFFFELADDVLGLSEKTVEQACLHVGRGVLGQDGARRFDLDLRKLSSL